MSDEYLTDDEQLEHVKRLAAEYLPWIGGAVLVGLATVFGLRFFHDHRDQRALAADSEFIQMTAALRRDDRGATRQAAESLIKQFPDSPYGDQAKLVLARLDVDEGQDAKAVVPLSDVMEHSKDRELRHIARLRLARVEIDAGKPDEALAALSDDPGAFAARYHEVRGDAYFAKKDLTQAASEYKAALAAAAGGGADTALLALKIADLGVEPAPATAAVIAPPALPGKAKP